MLKVGLTGSIAVGKSYVCEVFSQLGVFVLDADQTAREVVAKDSTGLRLITQTFGDEVLNPNGELDRIKMGTLVFADEAKRQILNSIVHPLVIEKQNDWISRVENENPDAICIIDAALMIESGGYRRFDQLIVVWCESDIQLERLMLRSDLPAAEALMRINAQMPQAEKKKYADFLIDTSASFDAARRQTREVFERLNTL